MGSYSFDILYEVRQIFVSNIIQPVPTSNETAPVARPNLILYFFQLEVEM